MKNHATFGAAVTQTHVDLWCCHTWMGRIATMFLCVLLLTTFDLGHGANAALICNAPLDHGAGVEPKRVVVYESAPTTCSTSLAAGAGKGIEVDWTSTVGATNGEDIDVYQYDGNVRVDSVASVIETDECLSGSKHTGGIADWQGPPAGTGTCAIVVVVKHTSSDVTVSFSMDYDADNYLRMSNVTFVGGAFGGAVTSTTTASGGQAGVASDIVQTRQNTLQNLQPNIGGFIDGTFGTGGGDLGQFALRGNEAGFNMAFASSMAQILSSKARNEALARQPIALDRANNAQVGRSQTSAFLYGQSVPNDADGVAQTSATFKKPNSGAGRETDALELDTEEQVYGSSAGAQEVDSTSQLAQARERGYDMWVQVYGAKTHAGNSDSTLWVGYAGAHGFVNDNLIVGGLVQLDWVDESNDTAGSSADGFGWMVGPYIAAKLPDQNVFFDARIAYGQSDNDITLTTSTGSFQTERWLVSAKVSGLLEQGEIEIRPAVGVSYFEETQESYTDSVNAVISSQTFTQGEIRFGPTFAKTFYQNNGSTLKPRIGINGVWNFSVDNGTSTTAVLDNGDLRARLDVGVTILGTERWMVDLSGFYDGIGINNYYAYGGKARLTVPLN